jgi:hypothetical protein
MTHPDPAKEGVSPMNDAQIKHMVQRFLGWRLPEAFNPDGGISFKKTFNEHTAHPMKHEPTGTNLFDAQQAEQMVRYLIEGLPRVSPSRVREETIEECGWVIEHYTSPAYEPLYWTGSGWSKEHLRAIRFAREVDADNTRKGWDDEFSMQHRVAEHGWV